jgi:thioredoxin 1
MSIKNISVLNFEEEVLENEGTVLLDFWADWCGPCMMLSPLLHEFAEENPEIMVGKVNVDEAPELAQAYGVSSIPTLVVVKDGKEVNRSVGVIPKAKIAELVK